MGIDEALLLPPRLGIVVERPARTRLGLALLPHERSGLDPLKQRRDLFNEYGQAGAPLALVSWGSVAGIAQEALELARLEGLKVKLLVPKLLFPVAEQVYRSFFASVQAGLVVEQSHQGQLYRMMRMFVDVPKGVTSFRRSGANPFQPKEVLARLREVALALQHPSQSATQTPAEE